MNAIKGDLVVDGKIDQRMPKLGAQLDRSEIVRLVGETLVDRLDAISCEWHSGPTGERQHYTATLTVHVGDASDYSDTITLVAHYYQPWDTVRPTEDDAPDLDTLTWTVDHYTIVD